MEFKKEEIETLILLLENEIKSDISYLDDLDGKELFFWGNEIIRLQELLARFKK